MSIPKRLTPEESILRRREHSYQYYLKTRSGKSTSKFYTISPDRTQCWGPFKSSEGARSFFNILNSDSNLNFYIKRNKLVDQWEQINTASNVSEDNNEEG